MFETAVYMLAEMPVQDIVEAAITAEAQGFDYFLVPDEGMSRDVFVTLSAIALNTRRIKFGPMIVNPYTRHPVTSAVTVATLDELSGGRAFIGYGIGGSLVLGPLGIEIHHPLKICREALEITRKLYAGETVQYQGDFFNLKDVKLMFGVRPDLPIFFAARGDKLLAQGGELADGLFLSGIAKFDLPRTVDLIRQGARKADRQPKIIYDVHIAYDDNMFDSIKAEYSFMAVDSPPHIQQKLGLSDEQIETIRQVMTHQGIHQAAKLIPTEFLAHFIIIGDDETCAREIASVMQAFDFQVLSVPIPATADAVRLVQRVSSIIQRARRLYG